MKLLITLLAFLGYGVAYATPSYSAPPVPSKVKFADVTLELDNYAKKQVQQKVNSLTRSSKYFQVYVDRCDLYFPIIESIFRNAGVPDDFKYMALHESALDGNAISSSKAVGYWQFKESTGLHEGLIINRQVDERRHIDASTRAAAKHLLTNYKDLQSWLSALVAHNQGLGGAQRSIGSAYRNKKRIKLNRRSSHYIFFILANKIAFEKAVGKNPTPPYRLYPYKKAEGKSLAQIAKQAGVSEELLKKHNPWLRVKKVPKDRTYTVVMPVPFGQEKIVASKLQLSTREVESLAHHDPVPRPDALPDQVAEKYVSQESSMQQRPQSAFPLVDQRKRVRSGRKSLLMVNANGLAAFVAERHTMSVVEVAEILGMSYKKILRLNDMKLSDGLEEGEVYYIVPKKPKAPVAEHIVAVGETVWEISQMYGIQEQAIRKKNRLSKKEKLKTGRVLLLQRRLGKDEKVRYNRSIPPKPVNTDFIADETLKPNESFIEKQQPDEEFVTTETLKKGSNDGVHLVKKGDTAYGIARNYGLGYAQLLELNPRLKTNPTLHPGQTLILKPLSGNSSVAHIEKTVAPKKEVVKPSKKKEESLFIKLPEEVENKKEVASDKSHRKATTHRVKEGETLVSIAFDHDIEVRDLLDWNDFQNAHIRLQPGQLIYLASKGSQVVGQYYVVERGDTLYRIATRYNLKVSELKELNNKADNQLNPGERIRVR